MLTPEADLRNALTTLVHGLTNQIPRLSDRAIEILLAGESYTMPDGSRLIVDAHTNRARTGTPCRPGISLLWSNLTDEIHALEAAVAACRAARAVSQAATHEPFRRG